MLNGEWDKNIVTSEVDNSCSVHVDNRKKDILVLGEDATSGSDDTAITVQAKYSINVNKLEKKIFWSLHYNESKSFLYAIVVKIY